MARLIVKSPYIKSGSGAGGYMKYIATRDGVEKLPQPGIYMSYIATRPGVERQDRHGLFGDEDSVELTKAMDELTRCKGNVWTHIISLRREDASRLGYGNANAWRNLLKTHRNDIAAAMKISPNHFRWYAAFHNEGEHPHIHMMAWSDDPSQGYLSKDGINEIKSKLTNDIFKQEMLFLYEKKSISRDELVRESRRAMAEQTRSMKTGFCDHPEVENLIGELALKLGSVTGKKQYGYLSKGAKRLVDDIVDQMERLPAVSECYEKWWRLSEQVRGYYTGETHDKPPLSQQKEFRAVKNAVIYEAERVRSGEFTFEDTGAARRDEHVREPETDYEITVRYQLAKEIIFGQPESLEQLQRAVQEMRSLAENGYSYAQYQMGKMYRDHIGVLPDAAEAKRCFTQAAEQNVTVAQYALGKLYLLEDTEVRDIGEGLRWLGLACENGNHYAGYRLGKEYLCGKRIPKDVPLAVEYLTNAAERGNQYAQYTLGKLYMSGQDLPQNKEMAEHWLTLSAEQGNEYAGFFLERLDQGREPSLMLAATRLLHHIGRIFQDSPITSTHPEGMRIDSKRRRKLMEKKQALGHARDDHTESDIHFSGY